MRIFSTNARTFSPHTPHPSPFSLLPTPYTPHPTPLSLLPAPQPQPLFSV
ncbi:hypothetical protein [Microcystis sp. M169S2]|nr:hypothetical protein [Microcystis sp. M169S2]